MSGSDSERSPLLPKKNKKKQIIRYRFQLIKSKGALIVLFWDFIVHFYGKSCIFALDELSLKLLGHASTNTGNIFLIIWLQLEFVSYLFYPLGGILGDVLIGRYKTIVCNLYSSIMVLMLIVACYILSWWYDSFWVLSSMNIIALLAFYITFSSFQVNLLPYNIDQLIGASGEELSAVIHWHIFADHLVLCGLVIVYDAIPSQVVVPILLVICGISLLLAIGTNCTLNKYLDNTPQCVKNPFVTIFGVLNYARKNKYPRLRSALTYWESTFPSRLDLSKEKYGGPFTEEEVEDVKTFLRLIPFLIVVIGFCSFWGPGGVGILAYKLQYNIPDLVDKGSYTFIDQIYLFISNMGIQFGLCALMVVAFQTFIYPFFYKYIPDMLTRVFIGLIASPLCSNLTYSFISLAAYLRSPLSTPCELSINVANATKFQYFNTTALYLPEVLFGIGMFLCLLTSMEFVVAQTPRPMRGLMVGLWYTAYGLGTVVSDNFYRLFTSIPSTSCVFYYYVANTLCGLAIVVVYYLLVKKRYKNRIRENIVPIHQIAEDYYNKYFQE